ncbi:alpha/beta fold hydrolase [Methylocystis sp. ATCC 49242]|uniref:alpha/beta fold hydrolase n=1 Tax=Methylocystis sp. ATCC 49242 TaxID=622637 RepID=UPI0001F87E07|nr:alpha/beta hydrolase [Methylocystis sp. ATCC 49242]
MNPPTPRAHADSRFVSASDGLRLHYLDYACPSAGRLPLVCLPGLARSADDFWRVAEAAQAQGRRVLALDYRGRGRSDWDKDWTHYALAVEQDDILAVLRDAGVSSAVFLGTSRGGLHTMDLAAGTPGLVRAAIFNDIGPKIELEGLLRIKRYVGKLPPIASMNDAIALMRMTAAPQFPAVSAEDWAVYARQTFVEKDGKVALRYDPELSHTLDIFTPDAEPETFWDRFETMSQTPMLVIRGETSDIFSAETMEEMARRAPRLETFTVAGQGHAPLLLDQPTIGRIMEFLSRCP